MHYGIKGQKWGVRRYQNTDGSWTAAGKARYSKSSGKRARYGMAPEALGMALGMGAAQAGVVGLMGYSVAQHIKANKQSAKNVMYDLERSGALKGLTADQIKEVEKEVKGSVRRNSYNSPVYSTEASARTAGERVASMYKGKRAKYGSENTVDSKTAVKVAKINRKIDKYNTRLQRAKVDNDAIQSMSTGRIAALQGAKSIGVTAGRAAPFIAEAGKAAVPLLGPTLLTTGLTNAALGAGVMGGMKAGSKTRADEKRLEKKIKKLQGQRYALDPSQANRKGSILTKEEYAKRYNANRGGMHGLAAGGLVGGLAGAALGAKSKNTRDAEYENYKKNAIAYGKKKRR